MNLDRVKEILSSDQEIAVHYHGIPVWIESIDPTSSMAVVSERGTHSERQLVSIDALNETGKYYT
ncbi:MAG TPA: H-type small acid-soluble spore protein [Bacillus sp. (in: firmicutes)]|nr:H-type small acid-soluble spore protein [Bacillus sp. (in: firmicutes)]